MFFGRRNKGHSQKPPPRPAPVQYEVQRPRPNQLVLLFDPSNFPSPGKIEKVIEDLVKLVGIPGYVYYDRGKSISYTLKKLYTDDALLSYVHETLVLIFGDAIRVTGNEWLPTRRRQ